MSERQRVKKTCAEKWRNRVLAPKKIVARVFNLLCFCGVVSKFLELEGGGGVCGEGDGY